MAIRDALLAILAQGPCYGNQLKHEYDRRTGGVWPLNVGQIYTTLDRLERDALVAAAAPNGQGHRVYRLTTEGEVEVARWFAEPLDDAPARDELATKIALAVTLAGVDAGRVVGLQKQATQRRLAALRARVDIPTAGARVRDGADLATQLILESQIGAVTAEAIWLDLVDKRIRQNGPGGGTLPLETEPPRRGRPPQM